MNDTIEPIDPRPSVSDTHSDHSIGEREFVPMETTEPESPRNRFRIAAILLALAVRTSDFSSCTCRTLEGHATGADVLPSSLCSSLP